MFRAIYLCACLASLGCSAEHHSAVLSSPATATKVAASESSDLQRLPSKTTLPPPVLIKSNKPIICIYNDYHFGRPLLGIEAVVWSDGKIVWFVGDKPLMGHTDVSLLHQLMTKLHEQGIFGNGRSEYEHAAADVPLEAIVITLPDRKLILRSCHELAGRYPKLIDMTQPPTEFERFFLLWKEIRSSVKSWIPSEGIAFVGEIQIDVDE